VHFWGWWVVGGAVGGGRWAVGVGGCALYAPLFGPATTAPKFCFRTHFCSLRLYAFVYTHTHLQT